jgi:chaperonin cofactor prefoldin
VMEPDAVIAAIGDLRDFTEFSLKNLSVRLERRFDRVENRLERVENRLEHVENRLGRIETRVEDLETTVTDGFHEVRNRLTALEPPKPRR